MTLIKSSTHLEKIERIVKPILLEQKRIEFEKELFLLREMIVPQQEQILVAPSNPNAPGFPIPSVPPLVPNPLEKEANEDPTVPNFVLPISEEGKKEPLPVGKVDNAPVALSEKTKEALVIKMDQETTADITNKFRNEIQLIKANTKSELEKSFDSILIALDETQEKEPVSSENLVLINITREKVTEIIKKYCNKNQLPTEEDINFLHENLKKLGDNYETLEETKEKLEPILDLLEEDTQKLNQANQRI